jgi:hypothetical protein
MYRSDGFLAPGVRVGRYHRLAEAIRRGCKLRPKKVRGRFLNGRETACALGAAAVGMRGSKKYDRWRMYQRFPELNRLVTHPLDGIETSLEQVVTDLNDQTSYSREQIADWLCREGGCRHEVQAQIS